MGRIARGAGVSSFGQGIGRVLNYITQITLARMYGPSALGFYVLGITTVSLANILSQFGMDNGVVRYVARYRAENDTARVRGTILLALWIPFTLSLVLASLIFFAAGFLADTVFDEPRLEPVFEIFAVALPFFTLMSMALWSMQGFQTVRHATYIRQVVQPFANLTLIVVFYLLGERIFGAAVAYVASMAIGFAFGLYYLRRTFPKLFDRGTPPKYEPRALLRVSGPMVIAGFTNYVTSWITVTMLGVFATTHTVGLYNAAARTAALSTLVLYAFTGIFSPMISSLYSRGSLDHLSSLYKDVSRWTFTGSLAMFLITLLLAKDIMAVFGDEFVPGWPAMVLIATAYLFSSSVGHTGRVLAMTEHQKMIMLSTIGSNTAAVAANFALVPLYGLMGAATATAAAIVLYNAITLLSVRRLFGFWPYNRYYVNPVAAGVAAAAVTYLLKLTLSLPLGVVTILVLAPVFLMGFVAFLFALGLSSSDRQFLATLWRALRRSSPTGPRQSR